tara:strand:+ start:147 stop:416 length:270 start_codon:yes stop_codon:yes gene_type:complete
MLLLTEEEKELAIQKRTEEIKILFSQATKKDDLDFILKTFSLKFIKNKKKMSPMATKMNVKERIIQMAIDESEDIFDYDHWLTSQCFNP